MEIDTIAKNILKNVNTGENVELQCFWQDKTTVVIFLRRWGCLFCHMWAKEVSAIAPILKRNNINLIGVGVEELGAKEFSDLKLFDGELFIDTDRKTYNGLGFKRFNLLSVLASLLWKDSRNAISKGRKMGLQGNLKGDGLQNGGALVVEKGGKVLRHFVQVGPSEQLSNVEILKLVGLEAEITNIPAESGDSAEKSDQKATVECNSEQCSVPAN